ncbi:STAS-like domain-containing protein [Providencia rettgeri]|uniref:STAS-like domain-containing protein n=2 Tax=Providencia TaxID=586 RepID=UPI001EE70DE6|nr:STAS-like domain-containing protein [Providencia rettgeri]EJD6474801.1 STAS-like domain-containing protein [Providencia rettgeri]
MSQKTITIVNDFSKKPYGRYEIDGDGNGERFRKKLLAPALREFDHVIVDLTGYNRYGRSFIDESFGGLIRYEGFTKKQLEEKLTYKHNDLPSIILLIDERINAAASV